MFKRLFARMNLRLFAEDGTVSTAAAPAGDAAGSTAPAAASGKESLANVQYGKAIETESQPTEATPQSDPATTGQPVDRDAEFEKLIKGEYQKEYGKRVEKAIQQRFRNYNDQQAKAKRADDVTPLLDMLAAKYGLASTDDIGAIIKAAQDDSSMFEEAAAKQGLTVEQYRRISAVERENARLREAEANANRQRESETILANWYNQGEALKQRYPSFDFAVECDVQQSPQTAERFLGLLKSGVDVQTAYEVVHKDEIIGGAMQYTAQVVQRKTVNDIRARGMRPSENGTAANAPTTQRKANPAEWTKKDMEEVARRVERGEKIYL